MPYTTYGLLKTVRSHQISSPSVQATLETGRPNACNLCHLDKTLAWTAAPDSDGTARRRPRSAAIATTSVAASLAWLLTGDAGQRAIVAQSMGWAGRAAGVGYELAGAVSRAVLDDPYDAVRYITSPIAHARSRRSGDLAFDFVAPPHGARGERVRAMEIWRRTRDDASWRGNAALLINRDGTFNAAVVNRLARARNNRRVTYRE